MKTLFRRLLLAALLTAAGAACAQTARDDSLFQAFGGQPGLQRLVDDFMQRLLADARIKRFFQEVDQQKLKDELVIQFCEVSGGPCRRSGDSMKEAHEAMTITKADFNALVEVLQQAMDHQGVAFSAQNRLLAQLAPMHRDIVNQ